MTTREFDDARKALRRKRWLKRLQTAGRTGKPVKRIHEPRVSTVNKAIAEQKRIETVLADCDQRHQKLQQQLQAN